MNRVVVQYRTRNEAADENQAMIETMFAALAEGEPAGLSYTSMRLEEEEAGTMFVHVAEVSTEDGSNPLAALAEFREFQTGLPDRTVEPPLARQATVIGSYGF
ncbi:MAG: hypothetical protein JJE23_11630 [Thermoleophilia bacterium]|jgi:hypothetical protein|nr:hypothetical protein [Thermoleophilia bacterium]